MAFFGDEFEEGLVGVGEFGGAFVHKGVFHLGGVNLFVDFVQDGFVGHRVDLALVVVVEFFHRVVGRGGIGLDVAAGEGGDVFVAGVGGLFGAGAGENDFLFEGEILGAPEILIELPEALGVDN